MSGLEQRTTGRHEAPAGATAVIAFTARSPAAASPVEPKPALPTEWSSIDVELLDERRTPVPAFPLDVLPPPWRDWAREAALSADAPVDYVAQAVLAAVAGGCGRAVWVWPTPDWSEPVRLWLAAVGAPSTGKTPAIEPAGCLLDRLADEFRGDGVILRDGRFDDMVAALDGTANGRLLWRDGDTHCFSSVGGTRGLRHIDRPALSILGTVEPDAAARALHGGPHGAGEAVAARFLYAWPHPLPFRRPARDRRLESGEVQDHLRRILRMVTFTQGSRNLAVEPAAAASFDAFHERLHPDIRQAEGLEAAWLGKGRGAVAALAGVFALMAWSATKSEEPPRSVDAEAMERAIALWSGYYRPHALAFFQRAVPTDLECQASRVVRWLRAQGAASVSRTEVRRSALAHTVDARGAERVVTRLVEAGVLQPMASDARPQRGRPALRWHVNPTLAGA